MTLSQKMFGTRVAEEIPARENVIFREISQYGLNKG
jgi:hypothetical protein